MTDKPINTFDKLWEQSELVSQKTFENISDLELINNCLELISNFKDLNNLNYPDGIKSSLKKKKMGEILFVLTAISLRENINVYAELQKQIAENEISQFKFNPQPKPTP